MMWHLQLLAEALLFALASDQIVNGAFALLVLWAGLGGPLKICALLTALIHLGLAFC